MSLKNVITGNAEAPGILPRNNAMLLYHRKYMYILHRTNYALQSRHNGHDDVSNHQPRDCLLNRLFRHRWKKTSKLRVTGLCAGNLPVAVNSPHKGPVTRKMLPFDDVPMWTPFPICHGLELVDFTTPFMVILLTLKKLYIEATRTNIPYSPRTAVCY